MSDDRGLAELTEALHDMGQDPDRARDWCNPWATGALHQQIHQDDAAAILGDRGVFWPTGTDEYRELIHQYQAEIERLNERVRLADAAAASMVSKANAALTLLYEMIQEPKFPIPANGPARTFLGYAPNEPTA